MTNISLAQSYLKKVLDRIDVLDLLFRKEAYSDVVREAQELVELAVKGMLRQAGIEPPKHHDVGAMLTEHRDRFQNISGETIERIAAISKALRKERELSFYGDIDFIPTEEYTAEHAQDAMQGANFVAEAARAVIKVDDS